MVVILTVALLLTAPAYVRSPDLMFDPAPLAEGAQGHANPARSAAAQPIVIAA